MADKVKQILVKPIQVADQVVKFSDESSSFRQECLDLKSKTSKLADLLRQAARSSSDLYERPAIRIISDTEQVLDKALSLALKYRSANGFVRRAFTIVPATYSRKVLSLLDNSIGDVSWLLRVSTPADSSSDDLDYLGLPPIAANEPILCLIWEQIAQLQTGSLDSRADAAASLVSLARDNDRYGSLIIEEGGVAPLLKLVKEGKTEGQENAARAIGLLGRDPESVDYMVHAGVCSVFAKVLKEGSMRVQAMVAWAVSELASHYPKCQDLFNQHNVVRFLVSHLAYETIQEHSKYTVVSQKASSIHQVIIATTNSKSAPNKGGLYDDEEQNSKIQRPGEVGADGTMQNKLHNVVTNTIAMKAQSKSKISSNSAVTNANNNNFHGPSPSPIHHSLTTAKARETVDPAIKANMKAMAARALWKLAKDNSGICRSITESRALLCFAVLLEKGADEIKLNSALALMEITAVAEKDSDLRRSAFKPTSPACKAVVDQLLRAVEEANSELLLPCIKAIGNLARTFRATETRMIAPLVALLDEREPEVSAEAASALTKFAGSDNYLHVDHSKAIIEAGGLKHLVQLVYFGEQIVKIPALVLLAYIAKHTPESDELAENEVLIVLEWALKQPNLLQEETEDLLMEAKSRVELYQSRGSSLKVKMTKGFVAI